MYIYIYVYRCMYVGNAFSEIARKEATLVHNICSFGSLGSHVSRISDQRGPICGYREVNKNLSILFIQLNTRLFAHLFANPSIYPLSICIPTYLSTYLPSYTCEHAMIHISKRSYMWDPKMHFWLSTAALVSKVYSWGLN